MDHGDSLEPSAKRDEVEAAAAGCSPKSDLEVSGVDAGGELPKSDMLKYTSQTTNRECDEIIREKSRTCCWCRGCNGAMSMTDLRYYVQGSAHRFGNCEDSS